MVRTAATRKGFSMAAYQIEITEDARADLSYYSAFERKTIVSRIRDQLTHQPLVATRNRKPLRDHPIASWELRVDNYRVFYEVDEANRSVVIIAVGHKVHNMLLILSRRTQP
jgi:mRNA-degrading endonuclease RelE of RelBE toxin-antitoxin system